MQANYSLQGLEVYIIPITSITARLSDIHTIHMHKIPVICRSQVDL